MAGLYIATMNDLGDLLDAVGEDETNGEEVEAGDTSETMQSDEAGDSDTTLEWRGEDEAADAPASGQPAAASGTPALSQLGAAPKASFRHRSSGGLSVADSLGVFASSQLGATPKAHGEAAAPEASLPVAEQAANAEAPGEASSRPASAAPGPESEEPPPFARSKAFAAPAPHWAEQAANAEAPWSPA